jgi:hypothetical protein
MATLGRSYIESEMPKGNGGDFTPIPDGWYDVTITEAVVKTTKAGTGDYLSYRCDVVGPTHQGRVVFGMITLRNPNPKAEDIGNQQMGELCRAIGAARLDDSDQLIGNRMTIKVITESSEQYGDKNKIKSMKASGGAQASSTSPVAAPVAASKPPWVK